MINKIGKITLYVNNQDEAKKFLDFLNSEDAKATFKKYGFETVS